MIHTLYQPTHWPRELSPFVVPAHDVEVKTVRSDQELSVFLARCFSYRPGWVVFLYWLRGKLVPLIGLKGHGAPDIQQIKPEDVPFEPGKQLAFFTVQHASERLWVAGVKDQHLTAHLAVEKQDGLLKVYTLVQFHHWTGKLYYSIIRPFHHLVVNGMIREGLK